MNLIEKGLYKIISWLIIGGLVAGGYVFVIIPNAPEDDPILTALMIAALGLIISPLLFILVKAGFWVGTRINMSAEIRPGKVGLISSVFIAFIAGILFFVFDALVQVQGTSWIVRAFAAGVGTVLGLFAYIAARAFHARTPIRG